jgi:hypothetical protein
MLLPNLASAKREELGVPSGGTGNGPKHIQQPRHSAHYTQHSHVRMHPLDRGVLNAACEVVEVLAEADFAHHVEAEEHGPC